MPGLNVLLDVYARADLGMRFSLLQRHSYKRTGYLVESWRDVGAGVALGRVDLGLLNRAPQPLTSIDGRYLLVAHGEIRDCDRVRQGLQGRGVPLTGRDHADVMLATYIDGGVEAVTKLNGSYFFALWDRLESALTLVSDRHASRPHLMAWWGDRLYVAPDVTAIREARQIPATMDLNGVAACLALEHPLGDDTNISGIQAYPAATVMRINAHGTRTDRYWQPLYTGGIEAQARPRGRWLDEAVARYREAVRRSVQGNVVVTLSGGTDTRMVVAFAPRFDFPVYTFGHPHSDELRFAIRVAKARGLEHHIADLSPDYLVRETSRILELGEGMVSVFHAHNSDGIDDVAALAPTAVYGVTAQFGRLEGIDDTLQAHGESMASRARLLASHAWQGHRPLAVFDSPEAIAQRVFPSLWLALGPAEIASCFEDDFAYALVTRLNARLLEEAARIRADAPEDWLTTFGLLNRQRRFTQWGLKIAGTSHDVRKVFDDYELVDFHLGLPAATRRHVVAEVIRYQAPDLARIPRTGSGMPIGASWARRAVGYGLRQLGKRGNPGRVQAFSDPQTALRKDAKHYFEAILLDGGTLRNGFFKPAGIRALWRQHQAGERHAASALLALVTFELWRRQLRFGPSPAAYVDHLG